MATKSEFGGKGYPDFQDHARGELESFLLSNPEYVDRMIDGLKKAGLDVPA